MKKFKKKDGFKSLEEKYPNDFDLVLLVDKNGKTRKGWWTGQSWDGLNIDIDPIAWKKLSDHHNQ